MERGQLAGMVRTKMEADRLAELVADSRRRLAGMKTLPEPIGFFRGMFDEATAVGLAALWRSYSGSLATFFKEIEGEVQTWPVVNLRLAVRPTERLINQLTQWFMNTLKFPVLLDLMYDPAIMAGVVIEWQGKYWDLSLSKKLRAIRGKINWQRYIREPI